jgi:hypothetical protein
VIFLILLEYDLTSSSAALGRTSALTWKISRSLSGMHNTHLYSSKYFDSVNQLAFFPSDSSPVSLIFPLWSLEQNTLFLPCKALGFFLYFA